MIAGNYLRIKSLIKASSVLTAPLICPHLFYIFLPSFTTSDSSSTGFSCWVFLVNLLALQQLNVALKHPLTKYQCISLTLETTWCSAGKIRFWSWMKLSISSSLVFSSFIWFWEPENCTKCAPKLPCSPACCISGRTNSVMQIKPN